MTYGRFFVYYMETGLQDRRSVIYDKNIWSIKNYVKGGLVTIED